MDVGSKKFDVDFNHGGEHEFPHKHPWPRVKGVHEPVGPEDLERLGELEELELKEVEEWNEALLESVNKFVLLYLTM